MLRCFRLFACAWCACACCWCILGAGSASAATLANRAKESGCTGRPTRVEGSTYKCVTQSGFTAYFNVPGAGNDADAGSAARGTPSPSGFPRVDSTTQKGRDDIRRKVLNEEQITPEKYAARVDRLRQAVSLHEKNIEALKKELAAKR